MLLSSAKLFEKILSTTCQKTHVKSGENWQVVSQKTFKHLYDFIHVQSPKARTYTPRG